MRRTADLLLQMACNHRHHNRLLSRPFARVVPCTMPLLRRRDVLRLSLMHELLHLLLS